MNLINADGTTVREFEANGCAYKVLPFEQAMKPERYFAYEELTFKYSIDMTPEVLKKYIEECQEILTEIAQQKTTKRNILHVATIQQGIIDTMNATGKVSKSRLGYMMRMCTLFIVRDGEDLTTWSEQDADTKIADWIKQGIHVPDFFSLALALINGWNKALTSSMVNG